MKENFERILKESLENYELPYENGAWEQFSKRLDGTPSTPFYRKWWFAASIGTVLVGSATYFMLSSGETAEKSANEPKQTEVIQTADAEKSNTAVKSKQLAVIASNTATSKEENRVQEITEQQIVTELTEDLHLLPSVLHQEQKTEYPLPVHNESAIESFAALTVPEIICINEPVELTNPNERAVLTVTLPGGKQLLVKPKETVSLKSSRPGTIYIASGSFSESISVEQSTAQIYIDVDDPSKYLVEGIPTIKFTAKGTDQPISWDSNIASQSSDKNELTVHPYVEKDIIVTATATDQNGCKVSETKSISLKSTYNLIAMSGFNPLDDDPRNNRFMPYALIERDAPFELTIMDPKNMQPVFKTNDANTGWDGTDSRTGQTVAPNTTWLWVVVMRNPLPGEPSEYRGLITRTNR